MGHRIRVVAGVVALYSVVLLGGCGDDAPAPARTADPASTSASGSASTSAPDTPGSGTASSTPAAPSRTPTPTPSSTEPAEPAEPIEQTGIDASHHQGPIDWPRVAQNGITFAYLKASEGTGFTDPRFAENRRGAVRAGLAVAGYHYFQLCSDGAAQARHFLEVLGRHDPAKHLAPALDLELAGSCTSPPPRARLLAEVREFLTLVDAHTGEPTVVYLYPEFEERFGFARDLADHPQWVRRLGDAEPGRDWQLWQYDDRGTVPGIAGGVDLNRRRAG